MKSVQYIHVLTVSVDAGHHGLLTKERFWPWRR